MTLPEIQAESDYRWLERAGMTAGDKELTEEQRRAISKEILEFENTERAKLITHQNEDQPSIPKDNNGPDKPRRNSLFAEWAKH